MSLELIIAQYRNQMQKPINYVLDKMTYTLEEANKRTYRYHMQNENTIEGIARSLQTHCEMKYIPLTYCGITACT